MVNNAAGVLELMRRLVTWDDASTVTFGGSLIVSPKSVAPYSELFSHEYGHILQARAIGDDWAYRLIYVLNTLGTSHATHPMEREANQLARLPSDWNGAPIDNYQSPFWYLRVRP